MPKKHKPTTTERAIDPTKPKAHDPNLLDHERAEVPVTAYDGGGISNAALEELAEKLEDAEQQHSKVAYLAIPKMPCRECGGSGTLTSGIFDDYCPSCSGSRVEYAPGYDGSEYPMPDFTGMRKAIAAYGDAKYFMTLAANDPRHVKALPPASSLPTLESIAQLRKQAMDAGKQLTGGAPGLVTPKVIAKPREADTPKGMLSDGDMGEISDAEIDDMEHG